MLALVNLEAAGKGRLVFHLRSGFLSQIDPPCTTLNASCTLTCFATPTCIVGCIGGKLKDDGAGDAAIDCVCKVIPDKYAKYC